MLFCTKCGCPLEENSEFCVNCGASVRQTPAAPVYAEPAPTAPLYEDTTPFYDEAAPTGLLYDEPVSYTDPVYAAPAAPVYAEPAPVYAEPAPVYAEPAPVYAEPAPATPVYNEPVSYAAPVYSQPNPYSTPVYSQPAPAPVPAKAKALGFVGMGVAIGGLVFAVLGLLYTFIGIATEMEGLAFGYSIAFALFSFPCSIVGRVLCNNSKEMGNHATPCSVGSKMGIAGIIVSAVMLFFGLISLSF